MEATLLGTRHGTHDASFSLAALEEEGTEDSDIDLSIAALQDCAPRALLNGTEPGCEPQPPDPHAQGGNVE